MIIGMGSSAFTSMEVCAIDCHFDRAGPRVALVTCNFSGITRSVFMTSIFVPADLSCVHHGVSLTCAAIEHDEQSNSDPLLPWRYVRRARERSELGPGIRSFVRCIHEREKMER